MLHEIPVERIGPAGQVMADAVGTCVHCGFCLPTCPTYDALGEEMDSPRGRIFLMKEVLEGNLPIDEAVPYIDRCLGCVGCVTSCPSGVEYGELLTPFRAAAEQVRKRSPFDRLLRRFVLEILPYPCRFRLAALLGRLARPLRRLVPGRMGDMLGLLPARIPPSERLPEVFPHQGQRRARVALLVGCAQQVLAPEINWATIRVLSVNGVEVVIPRGQTCCGALAAHTGAAWQARRFARANLAAFPDDVDAILTNAAGCGSGMHEYPLWLAGQPEEDAARRFAGRCQDVSKFLDELGLQPPPALAEPLRVAYHDACHLAHAQRVRDQPRRLLRSIGNIELVEIPRGELCCGSAGTYNIEQPEIAHQLGSEKARSILWTGCQAVATGNIGCMTQLATHLELEERPLPVYHTMQLLDMAYRVEHGASNGVPGPETSEAATASATAE
ncbi:MAG: 4Fe-4S dicluster domain-containing protein [Planctomycetota bacterium]|nr:MAG: 4Fe-4S dicluster domain-containing protein [Planctomycetota bacterium]